MWLLNNGVTLWASGEVDRGMGVIVFLRLVATCTDLKERKLGTVSQVTEGKMWLLTLIDRGMGHQRRPRGTSYKFKI